MSHVTRYVVTFINRDGMRALAHAAQGRHTYATAVEAQAWIDAARVNNSPGTLRQVYGDPDTLAVCACECWPGHFDPVGCYFDPEDVIPAPPRPILPVIFRVGEGGVTAMFPTAPATIDGRYFEIYVHVGQHGSGSWAWYQRTRPATTAEYAPLYAELRGIYETGPDAVTLQVCARRTKAHTAAFRAEVKRLRMVRT